MAKQRHVVGLEPVQRRLRAMGKKSRPLMRKALRQGGKIFQRAAKSTAPQDSGKSKKTIKVRAGKRSRVWTTIVISYGTDPNVTERKQQYAYQIEFGQPRRGVAPNPVMRRAYDSFKNSATESMMTHILNGLMTK